MIFPQWPKNLDLKLFEVGSTKTRLPLSISSFDNTFWGWFDPKKTNTFRQGSANALADPLQCLAHQLQLQYQKDHTVDWQSLDVVQKPLIFGYQYYHPQNVVKKQRTKWCQSFHKLTHSLKVPTLSLKVPFHPMLPSQGAHSLKVPTLSLKVPFHPMVPSQGAHSLKVPIPSLKVETTSLKVSLFFQSALPPKVTHSIQRAHPRAPPWPFWHCRMLCQQLSLDKNSIKKFLGFFEHVLLPPLYTNM